MEKINTIITYLEMLNPPEKNTVIFPEDVQIRRVINPPVHFYRYLYNTVGDQWLWHDRRKMDDEELKKQIWAEGIEIYVLYAGGIPAGYSELDFREQDNVNLVYFGLMPEFIGKGLGKAFLMETVNLAWQRHPKRLWVHTCTLDGPNALPVYKKAGFVPYKTEEKTIKG